MTYFKEKISHFEYTSSYNSQFILMHTLLYLVSKEFSTFLFFFSEIYSAKDELNPFVNVITINVAHTLEFNND